MWKTGGFFFLVHHNISKMVYRWKCAFSIDTALNLGVESNGTSLRVICPPICSRTNYPDPWEIAQRYLSRNHQRVTLHGHCNEEHENNQKLNITSCHQIIVNRIGCMIISMIVHEIYFINSAALRKIILWRYFFLMMKVWILRQI